MPSSEPNPRLERVKFELRATGVKPQPANPLRSGIHTRGYLPHVKREGAAYFLTFRLADSLPKEVLLKYEAERAERLLHLHTQGRSSGKASRFKETEEGIERDFRRKVERFLDKGHGECWLNRSDIAGLTADAFRFFDRKRYRLDAWVVMPNHVHMVLWPMPNETLSEIVQSLKRYTAREANKLLGRTGQSFWQPEPFDHWIRNDAEHARCCHYIRMNPVTARLCATSEQWQWSHAWIAPKA